MICRYIYLTLFSAILFFFCHPLIGQEQKVSISGQVVDTTGAPLAGATVVLLQQQDSVIESFTLAGGQGQFNLKNIKRQNYLLRITFLGLEPFSTPITEDIPSPVDLGVIEMVPERNLIEGVQVEDELIPITIKDDTIQYNAGAFKTKANAVVEDLLKKLPGVEVDRDGNIKAGGEDVKQVLVEGKEFFGNDPKIATKNLPADAVDKVQVFDKKSEMANFSGIDDGQENRAINLKLKEDKKKGVFGSIEGGYGTKGRYEGKLSLNRFDKQTQFSVLGMSNNTNKEAFSINDYMNFMGGLQNMMSGGGGSFRISLDMGPGGIPMNQMSTYGIRNASSGGINVNHEFSKKTELGVSYFYNRIKNDLEQSVFEQQFLNERDGFTTREQNDQLSTNNNHRLSLNLKHELDSFSRLSFRSNLTYNDAQLESFNNRSIRNFNGVLENSGNRHYQSEGMGLKGDASLTYMRRFRKKGRALVGNLTGGIDQTDQEADLIAVNNFADDQGEVLQIDSLFQDQSQQSNRLNYGGKVSYTEPLGKRKYLEVNYSHQNYGNDYSREVFDRFPEGNPDRILNQELSNNYDQQYWYDRGGLSFKWNKKDFQLNTGMDYQRSVLKGVIEEGIPEIRQTFYNWLPRLRWNYDFSTSRSINFDYRTAVVEPRLEQLNPVVDNSNPLNVYVGNPNLKPAYNHVLRLQFNSFSQFSFTSIFANITTTISQNPIRNAQFVDSLFIQTISPINTDDNYNVNAFFSFSTPVRFIKSKININTGLNYNDGVSFINAIENRTKQVMSSMDVSIENRKKDILDLLVGVDLEHTFTSYSISEEQNQQFLSQTYYADLGINIGDRWSLGSSVDHSIYSGEAFDEDQQITIWRASVSHYFLKNNRAELQLSAVDLLDQNRGINRITNLNYISETQTRSLGRYFMLTLRFRLSRFGGGGEGGIKIFQGRRRR